MSTLFDSLQGGIQLGAGNTTLITGGANSTTQISRAFVCNTDTVARTVTFYRVASGGSPGTSNTVTQAQRIAPGATYVFPELIGLALRPGDTLIGKADAGAVVNFFASGYVFVS